MLAAARLAPHQDPRSAQLLCSCHLIPHIKHGQALIILFCLQDAPTAPASTTAAEDDELQIPDEAAAAVSNAAGSPADSPLQETSVAVSASPVPHSDSAAAATNLKEPVQAKEPLPSQRQAFKAAHRKEPETDAVAADDTAAESAAAETADASAAAAGDKAAESAASPDDHADRSAAEHADESVAGDKAAESEASPDRAAQSAADEADDQPKTETETETGSATSEQLVTADPETIMKALADEMLAAQGESAAESADSEAGKDAASASERSAAPATSSDDKAAASSADSDDTAAESSASRDESNDRAAASATGSDDKADEAAAVVTAPDKIVISADEPVPDASEDIGKQDDESVPSSQTNGLHPDSANEEAAAESAPADESAAQHESDRSAAQQSEPTTSDTQRTNDGSAAAANSGDVSNSRQQICGQPCTCSSLRRCCESAPPSHAQDLAAGQPVWQAAVR